MDLNSQFKALQLESQRNPYPPLQERKYLLLAIKKALQDKAYDIADAVNKDFGHRSIDETLFLEIFPTIKAINFCLNSMNKWVRKRRRHVSWLFLPAQAYVMPQPVGVVGNIAPWNYPIYLALVPAIYAVSAGNRVMIKMSELSPQSGAALESLIQSLEIDHWVKIINGDVTVAEEFATLPFGHLLFTGSTAVGKLVMKAASHHLTPVTLELGGKSPAILSPTMNPHYFKRLFMGKLFNAGQTCIAPDYLLVPAGWSDKIEQEFGRFIDDHYPNLIDNENYTSLISLSHKEHLLKLVGDAKDKGARVVTFGEFKTGSNKMPVHLIFGVTHDMSLMHEEVFGPVLPVLTYQSLNEAVGYINSLPNPLALYYFGDDKAEQTFIRTKTLSGAFSINETLMHIAVDSLPFGGVGQSGMGHYYGREGFDTFSKLKPVFIQSRLSLVHWLYPPYKKWMSFFLAHIGGIKIKR